jgi:hypothetical protein
MHQDYIYPQIAGYLISVLQHVHHHVSVGEVGARCGCIVVDVQVQAVGPRPPLAHFHLQTRAPLRRRCIHPRWPPLLRPPQL